MGWENEKRGLLLLSVICVILMCSCRQNQDETQEIPQKSIYQHKEELEEGVTATLSIYYGTIYNAPMMDAVTRDYLEATGVQIVWQAADSGSTTLKGKFAIGEAPDLFQLAQFDLPQWKEHLTDLSGETWIDDVYDQSLQAGTVDGKLYGWPHTLEASGIVYNKDLFAQAGITKEPETFEELKEACRLLEQAGIQSFGESWMEFGYLHTCLHRLLIMKRIKNRSQNKFYDCF